MTLDKFKNIMLKFIASGAALTFTTVGFIWVYLLYLGRTDLFLKAVAFNNLLSFSGFIILLSSLLFLFIFYSPSFLGCLVITRENTKIKGYVLVRKIHTAIFFLTTFISFTFLVCLAEFTNVEINHYSVLTIILCSTLPPVLMSLILNRKIIVKNYNKNSPKKEKFELFSLFIGRAFFIGIVSWMFCFPLPLVTQNLKLDNFDSESVQVIKYYGLGILILGTTMLPGLYFLQIRTTMSIIKQGLTTLGIALLFLVTLSFVLPVIPALIFNFATRLVGMSDFEVIRPAISVENRPAEKFKAPQWNLSISEDGKFYLFDGVKFFSFGTLELVCPPNVIDTYKDTLHYILASKDYDKKTREKLHSETKTCQIFNSEELRY